MNKEQILEIVANSDSLPTLSTVASKLISVTADDNSTVKEIAELISMDISISTKILKIVNSTFYSFPQKIGTVQQAVSILGRNAVRNLVLSFSFLKVVPDDEKEVFDYERFWEQSLAAGVSAKLIMKNVSSEKTEEIFVAGLLQNIGELFLARCFPQKYEKVISLMANNEMSLVAAETSVFGTDHTFIGSQMASKWGFPQSLYECIAHHHSPDDYEGSDKKIKTYISVIYLSGVLSNIFYSKDAQFYLDEFKRQAKEQLLFSDEVIDTILDMMHTEVEQAAQFFGIKVENTKSINEILQEANKELSQLNMSYDQMNRELMKAKEQLQILTAELQEKNVMLQNLANMDGLTEVHNHRFFQNFLEKELQRSKRYNTPLSLIIADIDHFKKFNDTYGHQTGDFILKEYCLVSKAKIRQYDLIARYGGEEFVYVLPETDLTEAKAVAEKIRKNVESHIFNDGSKDYSVSISLGVASFNLENPDLEKDQLIEYADKALYVAKKNGRNRVVVYAPKKKEH